MNDDATALEQSCEAADREFSSAPVGEPLEACARSQKTWIDLELVDDDGKPVPHRRVRITLSDGRAFEGMTDGDGLFGIDGIDPDECTIEGLDVTQDRCTLLER